MSRSTLACWLSVATSTLIGCMDPASPEDSFDDGGVEIELVAPLTVGVVPSSQKVRPSDSPAMSTTASLKAGRNEFEAFQIVLKAGPNPVSGVTATVSQALTGPAGAKIPAANVVLYAERYYNVGVPSNDEGATGAWPDPLVPDVDTYFGQKRNAFPLQIPASQNRVVWVDVLVPQGQAPGDYTGEIAIAIGGTQQAVIPVSLHVGTFTLPSTSTLATGFGMGWDQPAKAHCPGTAFPFCTGITATTALRALYIRSALEHRITIAETEFQPPTSANLADPVRVAYEQLILPMIKGTASLRLPGAKLTSVFYRDTRAETIKPWLDFAKVHGFADRLLYYPTDEPGAQAAQWTQFRTYSNNLHAIDSAASILITSSIQDAASSTGFVDVFVPVLDQLENRSGQYAGNQRAKYDAWLAANPKRKIWSYQSCDQHGCGECGTPSPGLAWTGWPNRVIDTSGVQARAFPWQAFRFRVTGELYWDTTYQLGASVGSTAWENQCSYSGHGDGTIFYPGTVARIGGTKDIPIESIRLKQMRDGMEDYEYLAMVARTNPTLARSIADNLFPNAYGSAKPVAALEAARAQLFAALDAPPATDTVAPSTPTGLAGTPSATSIALRWNAATDNVGVVGYEVLRAGTVVATSTGTSVTVPSLTPNTSYTLTVRAKDAAGNRSVASASIVVKTLASATGLSAQYFANQTLTGPAALSRIDGTVNFNWGTGSPGAGVPADVFSARWTGTVIPQYSQPYTFFTTSDDGVRLWVNGVLLVNNWTPHGATENSGTITLAANTAYQIKLEYFERRGQAVAKLAWSSASQPKQIVPQARLRP